MPSEIRTQHGSGGLRGRNGQERRPDHRRRRSAWVVSATGALSIIFILVLCASWVLDRQLRAVIEESPIHCSFQLQMMKIHPSRPSTQRRRRSEAENRRRQFQNWLHVRFIISDVEAVEVHHLDPRGDEVVDKLLLRVVARVTRRGRAAASSSRRRCRRPSPARRCRRRRSCRRTCGRSCPTSPTRSPSTGGWRRSRCSSRPGVFVSTPSDEPPAVAPIARRPPTCANIFKRREREHVARSISIDSGAAPVARARPPNRSCGSRRRWARGRRTSRGRSSRRSRRCAPP